MSNQNSKIEKEIRMSKELNKQKQDQLDNSIETDTVQTDKEIIQFSSVHGRQSHKLHLDKYYTPRDHADHVVKKTFELIGAENITEVVETSAGAGVFLDAVEDYLAKNNLSIPVYGYDLEPEREDIVQQDYLEFMQYYLPGRLIIGNPPFGQRMQLAKKFFQKGVREADYISWILPGGQYNNSNTLYEFDLTYSELLGEVEYSGSKTVNSTFNIYERPDIKLLNKRGYALKLQDVKIYSEHDKGYREMDDYDVRMVYWGSAGKILQPDDKDYAGEFKIKVFRDDLRDQVVEILNNVNWEDRVTFSAMPRLKQKDIFVLLKEMIPDIN